MLFEIDNILYSRQQALGVRLEDLKNKPRKTIPAICKWLGIEDDECLYYMTAQGKKWWGDSLSNKYLDGLNPNFKNKIVFLGLC